MAVRHLKVDTVVERLYLLMALVLIGGFFKIWFVAFLAFPLFISVLVGIPFSPKDFHDWVKSLYHKKSFKVLRGKVIETSPKW